MKTNYVVLVLVSLAFAQCKELKYDDCGSAAKILSLQIEPCNTDPCVFKRGNTTTIKFSLIIDQDSATATLDARMKVFGMMMPIPGVQKNLCKAAIQCPMTKGDVYNGTVHVRVPKLMPSIRNTVQMKVTGDAGVSVCLRSKIAIA